LKLKNIDFIFSAEFSSVTISNSDDTTQKSQYSGKIIEGIFESFKMALQKNVFPNPFLEKLVYIHNGGVFVEISKEDYDYSLKSMAELFRQFAFMQRYCYFITW